MITHNKEPSLQQLSQARAVFFFAPVVEFGRHMGFKLPRLWHTGSSPVRSMYTPVAEWNRRMAKDHWHKETYIMGSNPIRGILRICRNWNTEQA